MSGSTVERRKGRRLKVILPLIYRVFSRRGVVRTGSGRTCDVSRKGVLFEASEALDVGSRLALSIAWPVLVNGTQEIDLVLDGTVIRTESSRAVLQIAHYQFEPRAEPERGGNEPFVEGGTAGGERG